MFLKILSSVGLIFLMSNNAAYAMYTPFYYSYFFQRVGLAKPYVQPIEKALNERNFAVLYNLIQSHENIDEYIPLIKSNLSAMLEYQFNYSMLDAIWERLNPTNQDILDQDFRNLFKHLSANAIANVSKSTIFNVVINQMICHVLENESAIYVLKVLDAARLMHKKFPVHTSPTIIHLMQNPACLKKNPLLKYKNNAELLQVLDHVIEKERNLRKQGYYTFLHGQRRVYYMPEWWFTKIWQAKHMGIEQPFLFAHVKPLLSTQQEIEQEKEIREYLLAYGRKPKDSITRQKLLFLNYGLFAQMNDMGSNTAYFVANNRNWGSAPITVTCKDAFKIFGLESIYRKYESQIESLALEFEKGDVGNLLMIGVKEDNIDQYVYLCEAGKGLSGRGGVRRSIWIDGIGHTSDINLIMNTLVNNPERISDTDDIEFCLIMTQLKGGLDPYTGIEIHPIITGDSKRIERLHAKAESLWASIEKDIKHELMKQKTMSRIAKIQAHLNPRLDDAHINRASMILEHLAPRIRY